MWITKLELRNIKSHADSGSIPFAYGVNAISGPNGAGKSTLLEAIGFALFDSLPYTQSQFLREGEKSGEVVVTFVDVLDEREYQVVRSVGTSSIYIFDPETKSRLVTGKADVVDWLKEHLGVDPSADLTALFEDSIGVPQGLLTAAFLERPAGRKSNFDPLLQVDEYEDAWLRLREVTRVLSAQTDNLRQTIAGITGELIQLPEMKKDHSGLAEEIEAKQASQQQLQTELEQLELEQTTLDEQQANIRQLERKIEKLAAQQQTLSSRHADAESSVQESQAAADKIGAVRGAYNAYQQAEEKLKELEIRRTERDRQLQTKHELEKEIALLGQSVDGLQDALKELQSVETQIGKLEPQVKRQMELENQLLDVRTRAAELEAQNALLAEEQTKLTSLESRLAETSKSVEEHSALTARLESSRDALQALELRLATLEANRRAAELQLQKVDQHRAALDESKDAACPVCHQPLDDRHRTQLVNDYSEQTKQLQEQARLTEQEREAALHTHAEKQSELEDVERRLAQLPDNRQLDILTAEVDAMRENINSRRADLKELDPVRERLAELKTALKALDDPKTSLSLLKAQLASRDDVEKELEVKSQRLQEQKSTLKQLQSMLDSYQGLEDELATTRAHRQDNEAGYRSFLENSALAKRLDERREKLSGISSKLAGLSEELEGQQQLVENVGQAYDESRHTLVRSEVIEKSREIARLETLIEEQGKRLTTLESQISVLAKKQEELERSEAELKRTQETTDALEFIRATIRNAGPHVTRALVQTISIEANRIFGEIMNDHSLRLIWNQDYSISLEQGGEQRDFSQLSGGEKTVAALSVRLALLRELSQIRVAFFDEPTSNLDDHRRENLASQITQITGFNQLFVISHDDTFERETHHVIRVNKAQGASAVEVG